MDLTLQVKRHNLTVNLTTLRVWCYACEREVFLEQRLAVHLPSSSARLSEQVYRAELRLLVGNSVQMGHVTRAKELKVTGSPWQFPI